MSENLPRTLDKHQVSSEAGQSIVLIALVFVVLIAFVGLAVDVGFGFVRSSQFAAAVDAATLAGVVDLAPSGTDTLAADARANQFLAANGWPQSTLVVTTTARSLTDQGIPQYSYTATWPVDLFFIRIVGFEGFRITRSATAAFYAQSELYTATNYDRGHLRLASEFIYGQDGCTWGGDPVSPEWTSPGVRNPDYSIANGVYRFRFRVPSSYTATNTVRIEIFDPDTWNNAALGNSVGVTYSDAYAAIAGGSGTNINCTSLGFGDQCFVETNESRFASNQNPLYFQRVDESWNVQGSGCTQEVGTAGGNTVTTFELYYFDDSGNRQAIANYVDDNSTANTTDLNWISPTGFEVDLSSLTNLPADSQGARFLHMDVSALNGSSMNVFDVWAGYPQSTAYYSPTLPSGVNSRNLVLANNPAVDPTGGVEVFALGRMPVQHWWNNVQVKLPLAPVDTTQGGGTVYVTMFDYDIDVPPNPITYSIDSLSIADFYIPTSIVAGTPSPTVPPWEATCTGGADCNNSWFLPQYRMGIPQSIFTGGTLFAEFNPERDNHTWFVAITAGRPFLTR